MDSSCSTNAVRAKKEYKCPCGKSYLSNSAIYTHIKRKHDGRAPGKIEKKCNSQRGQKRGAPPSYSRFKGGFRKYALHTPEPEQKSKQFEETETNQEYHRMFKTLSQISEPSPINPMIWSKLEAFRKLEEFVDSVPNVVLTDKRVCIGVGISQFLQMASKNIRQREFQQLLIVFILLLQYSMIDSKDQNLIKNCPLESLIDFMNPFMSHQSKEPSLLPNKAMEVMEQKNISTIFQAFYHWMKEKGYTDYCITLI